MQVSLILLQRKYMNKLKEESLIEYTTTEDTRQLLGSYQVTTRVINLLFKYTGVSRTTRWLEQQEFSASRIHSGVRYPDVSLSYNQYHRHHQEVITNASMMFDVPFHCHCQILIHSDNILQILSEQADQNSIAEILSHCHSLRKRR